jgi:Uma2 family endonuclease
MPEHQKIIYPESDGKPMADNTKQFRWIFILESGLESLFEDNPNVFVAGNLLWYPVNGKPKICAAPDALVVFGRPKGDRGSYLQWEEENLPPQVVFEVLSPGNTKDEMKAKQTFYERYGVEEYYIYDPDNLKLTGWIRRGERLEPIAQMKGWNSSLLGLRFELDGPSGELKLYRPDGKPFATAEQQQRAEQRAEQEYQRAEQEYQRAELAEKDAQQKQLQIELERQRAEQESQRAQRAEQDAHQKQLQIELERQRAELAEKDAEQKQLQIELERQRAELAEKDAHQKQQQIELERQRIEQLLVRLKAEGIELGEL